MEIHAFWMASVFSRTASMIKFFIFDLKEGQVIVESGVTIAGLSEVTIPSGYFVRVTPGTKHVTIGGAIANDVHGKNHQVAGSFGAMVLEFELLRTDGSRLICSRDSHADYFYATIGGLGLTGHVIWARLQLQKISSTSFEVECIKFNSIEEFFSISDKSRSF
jgi:FAD/FMN-containing dehydrogenase